LLSAIEVIKQEKKKNKSLQVEIKERGVHNSDSEELEKMITKLKIQLEEDRRIK
jgi:tRNA(Ser,Leu) C12 N-acetylase TAN1